MPNELPQPTQWELGYLQGVRDAQMACARVTTQYGHTQAVTRLLTDFIEKLKKEGK